MKLSVCIVTYNHESLIRQCIESAVRQNVFFDYEIVVGEDCSTDGTRAVLEMLAAQYPDKIRLQFRPHNLGAEQNFNKTISECRGEYIAFLEGDNFWTSADKLQKQADFLDAHAEAAFCFHRAPYIDASGARLETVLPLEDPPALTDIQFLLQDSNPVPLGSILARRALLEGLADWVKGLKLGDWPLCMMLASRGKIGFIPEEMSIQRVHKDGAWQLLPPPVQVIYMMQMLNHVVPRLDALSQSVIAEKTKRFLDWLSGQMIHSDADTLKATFQKLRALSDAPLTMELLEAAAYLARTQQYEAKLEKNKLINALSESERLLAKAHAHPLKLINDLLKFRALTFLSTKQSLFSDRKRERLARSASKRDPNRFLRDSDDLELLAQTKSQSKSSGYVGRAQHDPARHSVLIVSHEASRTGAPILALNIAQALAKRYNVITLTLRSGELLDAFRATSTEVLVAKRFHHDGTAYHSLLRDLCSKHRFSFAVVNSLESRGVLSGLNESKVPVLSLIHEFSSYTHPKSAILDVFKWSSETIFSTKVTLENALQENGLLANPGLYVLPQGKCTVPTQTTSGAERADEVAWLTSMLRPASDASRPFLVIGAGTVNIRKGVDLFIEVATRVLTGPEGADFRFAWIGGGYDPYRDFGYSVYLRDQLRRAGIADRVLMLRETSEIETAYELADALLISSRLDPLPNVAIDALSAGLPVLCFDRTTGIADILEKHGLGAECVASYIDTAEMAQKVRALGTSEAYYASVSLRSRELAAAAFDFDAYVDKIEQIAQKAMVKPQVQSS